MSMNKITLNAEDRQVEGDNVGRFVGAIKSEEKWIVNECEEENVREMVKRCYFKCAFDLLRNDNVNKVRMIYWFYLPTCGKVFSRDKRDLVTAPLKQVLFTPN